MNAPLSGNTEPLLWPAARLPVALSPGVVHVWAWSFNITSEPAPQDLQLLDDDERRHTARFKFMPDRARYSACHANMRRILASYQHRSPGSLEYRQLSGGKPELVQPPGEAPLRFNLSHSKTIALLAVTLDSEVGVDVENVRPIETGVAERFFSASEFSSMSGLTGRAWLDAFYRCWTRKEAILKVEGVGLRVELNSFDVSVRDSEPAALLAARPEAGLTAAWQLHHLAPAEGVIGALAIQSAETRVIPLVFDGRAVPL